MPICVCPAMEEAITGWNGHRGETDKKKGLCLQNHLNLQGRKLQKIKCDLNSHVEYNEYKLLPTCFIYTKQKKAVIITLFDSMI